MKSCTITTEMRAITTISYEAFKVICVQTVECIHCYYTIILHCILEIMNALEVSKQIPHSNCNCTLLCWICRPLNTIIFHKFYADNSLAHYKT